MNFKKAVIAGVLLVVGSTLGFAAQGNSSATLDKQLKKAAAEALLPEGDAYKKMYARLYKSDKEACNKILGILQRNEWLPFETRNKNIADYKKIVGAAAQNAVKKYKNYAAYRNAAIIYAAEDSWDDTHNISANSLANATKYADSAIEKSGNNPVWEMYLIKAEVADHYYNFAELSNMSVSDNDVFTKEVKRRPGEVKAMLKDYEKVGKLEPKQAPWGWMAQLYEALGNQKDASLCQTNSRTYKK